MTKRLSKKNKHNRRKLICKDCIMKEQIWMVVLFNHMLVIVALLQTNIEHSEQKQIKKYSIGHQIRKRKLLQLLLRKMMMR